MFESRDRLAEDIGRAVGALRAAGDGRYACLLDGKSVLFESAEPGEPAWALRKFLEDHRAELFALPEAMAGEGPSDDLFEDWVQDDFFIAILNRKAALVVACPDGEALREPAGPLLKILADRLFRYEPALRLDARGHGFFFGRAQLDVVVVARADGAG
jgi:hypothetical protein